MGAVLLLVTLAIIQASAPAWLTESPPMESKAQEGVAVTVGVAVVDGVLEGVNVSVGVGVSDGVKVIVGVKVSVGVSVIVAVEVFEAVSVGAEIVAGKARIRDTRNCSMIPSRLAVRWIFGQ
jgi:hypothetical protein